MNDLAASIEEQNQQAQEDILAELAALSVVLIDALNALSTTATIKTVSDSGTEKDVKRTTIATSKLSKVLAEIDRLEKRHYSTLIDGLLDAMEDAARTTAEMLSIELDDVDNTDIVDIKDLSDRVVIGDKTLKQRVKITSSNTMSEVRKRVRQRIIGGDDVNTIVADIRNTFKDTDWTIRRIIESEIYNTYRYQFGTTTAANGYDWIKLHESFPRHPRRKKHKCYELANTDKYGKGDGVYKSSDTIIYYPHPQCTSWLEVVEVRS